MCGRFVLKSSRRIKLDRKQVVGLLFEPRYNIAPSQTILVIGDFGNGIEERSLTWGLIPSWSGDGKGFINARCETLEERPSFSESFQKRRCLIPADGFFEWKRTGKWKQPHYFQLENEDTFAFAGIWDSWERNDTSIKSCAIITTAANELVAQLHDRMPVILQPQDFDIWMDPKAESTTLRKLLTPISTARMKSHPVSSAVNHPENDSGDLIKRVDIEVGTNLSLF
ncbi:MAG TPA: SOS response-associated peptidase [Pyrinomonadaceae bacterium]